MYQLKENKRFTARFIAAVSVLALVVSILVYSLPIIDLPRVLGLLKFIGIVSLAAWLATIALNNYLWRKPPFSWLLRIPDFSGRWEGWYRRSDDDEWRHTAHEISQKALDINAEAWGPDNWARGTSAAIVVQGASLTPELVWAYKAEPTTAEYKAGDAHAGVHFLRLSMRSGGKFLDGRYINDRAHNKDEGKGSVGEIHLKWVSSTLRHHPDFKEEGWGLTQPSRKTSEQ